MQVESALVCQCAVKRCGQKLSGAEESPFHKFNLIKPLSRPVSLSITRLPDFESRFMFFY